MRLTLARDFTILLEDERDSLRSLSQISLRGCSLRSMEKTLSLSLVSVVSLASLVLFSSAVSAQSMSASISMGGTEQTKSGQKISVYQARSQTYLTTTTAGKAVGLTATFLPRTTYVFDFSDVKEDKLEKYKKYQTAERLLLPTMGFFVEALRRDNSGVQGNTFGAGMSFRTVQVLRESGNRKRAALAPFAGTALGFWRTEAEGKRASRLGSRVFVGAETRNGLVLEASYSDRPSVQGFAPRGASLSLGLRF